jgi:hypothetical protein
MLTESQEERLRTALGVLLEMPPDNSDLVATVHAGRHRPGLTALVAFLVVVGVLLPLRLIGNGSTPQTSDLDPLTQASSPNPSTPAVSGGGLGAVSFGEPSTLSSPGRMGWLVAGGGALYASTSGFTDRVMRSTDGGLSWDMLLEADPGDSEGLFGVGDLIVQVIEDDNPARDTVSPASAVTEALKVLVFDPATGDQWETVLPRPDDPQMDPLDGNEGCALGSYQSWILADGVTVGDRLVVIGHQQLVGRLADGTVICDGQVYQYLTWTSDDGGHTWQMHESQPLLSIAWTGEQYVAWSTAGTNDGSMAGPESILISADGVNWTVSASAPPVPEGSLPAGAAIVTNSDAVIAWAGMQGWATQIPDNVTDPEQLRDVLDIDRNLDIEEILATIGVDLPLDDQEAEAIARYNGSTGPTGAIIAISTDGGSTWTTTYLAEPVTGVASVDNTYVALTSSLGNPYEPEDDRSSLLTSTDGISWTHAIDLPELGFGPALYTASSDAIYVSGARSGTLWKIPKS